ncbi:TRAFs-binding domain-containing protein, partial [Clostridium akagii]|uniref:TRAFs-binding domain-containing protein n=1 Tax=Clostridium akagii TaxID=91623 RepID=UPI000479D772
NNYKLFGGTNLIKNCFVIMGFGKKICPNTQRTIDLDVTYNKLIKPTMINLNIECIRSDEVITNKSIDTELYELLYKSDLVIADISTLNSNAIYELGVRHALKPYTTIIIAENQAVLPFDINHLRIHKYIHDGLTISNMEIDKLSNKLVEVINELNSKNNPDIDSPLYTSLDIKLPNEMDQSFFHKISSKYEGKNSIYKLLSTAQSLKNKKDFIKAEQHFRRAFELTKDEYIVKELAVCIYKQNESSIENLEKAEKVLVDFTGEYTIQNFELLSTFGAIYKKKWYINKNIIELEKCLDNYKRSYELSNNYYAGVNYAYSLMMLSHYSKNVEVKVTNYFWSKKIYKEIIILCEKDYDIDDYWINATLQEAYLVQNNNAEFTKYQNICEKLVVANDWKLESTLDQINHLELMLDTLELYNKIISC